MVLINVLRFLTDLFLSGYGVNSLRYLFLVDRKGKTKLGAVVSDWKPINMGFQCMLTTKKSIMLIVTQMSLWRGSSMKGRGIKKTIWFAT